MRQASAKTIIRLLVVACASLLLPGLGHAQEDEPPESERRELEAPKDEPSLPWWVPTHAKLQYAGNIGWLSAGAGYAYLDDILETELFFGYVPAYTGSNRIATATLKQLVVPYEFDVGPDVHIAPVVVGGFASYTFGSEYYLFAPDHLEGWYSRQTALRYGPLFGGRVRADIEPFGPIDSLGFYWEFTATDLAIDAYIKNPEFLDFYDILALGLGVRVGFR